MKSVLLPTGPSCRGLTLVELLVVIAVIGLLIALLLPAVQNAREAARDVQCRNHLKQIVLALQNFETSRGHYPPSYGGPEGGSWSAQARLLPYLEEDNLHDLIDFEHDYSAAKLPGGEPLSGFRVPTYLCPSELRDEARMKNEVAEHYPLNYGVNLGVWFVYDPKTREGGEGVFYPHSRLKQRDIVDGLSNTLCAAEVKAYTPYFRNAALFRIDLPVDPADVCPLGGEFKSDSGHTEWVDGRAHQIGFTTVFGPNAVVRCIQAGKEYDVDWTNQQEGKSDRISTWAAATARSHHPGKVNAAMMDGSVRSVGNGIELEIWRSLSRREGGELAQEF